MSVYLGNQFIGNGNYLGNQNITDNNIFMPPTTSTTTTPTLPPSPCWNQTLVYFTCDDGLNFEFGLTLCNGNQYTITGGSTSPITLTSFYGCLRQGGIIGLGRGTVVTSTTGSNQCGTFTP